MSRTIRLTVPFCLFGKRFVGSYLHFVNANKVKSIDKAEQERKRTEYLMCSVHMRKANWNRRDIWYK